MTPRAEVTELSRGGFDVVVVGGGIFGACAAWDATLRGLRVALVEKGDFCSGTSAHSYKIVHGGIRYIQHLDVPRLRSSCRERSALLRIAPHLVHPLPTAIPTYADLRKGKALLGSGMFLYDLLTVGRNRDIPDPSRHIPWSRFLSKRELLERFPGLPAAGLTGAAVFCDAQMYNPPRLVWAFLESAMTAGLKAVNYCRAVDLVMSGNRVSGCVVRDELSGEPIEIKTRSVLNAAGPWAEELFGSRTGHTRRAGLYSRDACFVVRRRFESPYAVAVPGESSDADAVLGRGARHMFIVPWRDYTLVGVWHVVYDKPADDVAVSERELAEFIVEMNRIYPGIGLSAQDVTMCNAGLVPFGEKAGEEGRLSFGKRSIIVDHRERDDILGLVSLIGIRYTMGRGDAQRAVDTLCRGLGWKTKRPPTHRIALVGGCIDNLEALVARARREAGSAMPDEAVRALVRNHGTRFRRVLDAAGADEELEPLGRKTTVTAAELKHVARHERVYSLADAVLRRTDLASGGTPGREVLERAASVVGDELGWSEATRSLELDRLGASFSKLRPAEEETQAGADHGHSIKIARPQS